mmetsp:Transcript_41310/g.62430  ORF Transcript_41310/g.62430 Transcript_41310/m.62430 type:complete len:98 (-) Transcript_41310:333-626(-)
MVQPTSWIEARSSRNTKNTSRLAVGLSALDRRADAEIPLPAYVSGPPRGSRAGEEMVDERVCMCVRTSMSLCLLGQGCLPGNSRKLADNGFLTMSLT